MREERLKARGHAELREALASGDLEIVKRAADSLHKTGVDPVAALSNVILNELADGDERTLALGVLKDLDSNASARVELRLSGIEALDGKSLAVRAPRAPRDPSKWLFLGPLVALAIFWPAYSIYRFNHPRAAKQVVDAAAKPPIPIDQAVPYEVVQREDISSRNRRRLRAFIYSAAESPEIRIQTCLKAAIELQKQTGCSLVKIFHLIAPDPNQAGKGTYYADLSYAPDGLGVDGQSPLRNVTWEAAVTDAVADRLTLEAERLWWANRSKFQRKDSFGGTETDEEALKRFVAGQMGVKPDDVRLAAFAPSPYSPYLN